MDVAEFEPLDPSLKNVIDQKSLRLIFVGGIGGSGKTTCSCSLAVQLSKVRESVLIMSTDRVQNCNLSKAFNQEFSMVPTKVNGFDNLFARVMHPNVDLDELPEEDPPLGLKEKVMQDLLRSLPGAAEVDIYGEITSLVLSMDYSVLVFDTAPGQTPRLLAFIQSLELEYGEAMQSILRLEPPINQEGSLIGSEADEHMSDTYSQEVGSISSNEVRAMYHICRQVNSQLKDPNLTTFVCVCNPDLLSLSETENLVRELSRCGMDIHNIVVNKMLQQTSAPCALCAATLQEQDKFLKETADLQRYFHVTKLPLLDNEVHGTAAVCSFSEHLLPESEQSYRPIRLFSYMFNLS